jgi:hypothetical protein
MADDSAVAAHAGIQGHRYLVHYPAHPARTSDPYYADFGAYKERRRHNGTWTCDFAVEHRGGDTGECDLSKPLECHHRFIEFAVQNSVDLALLEKDYPGVSSMEVGAWVESAANLMLLCIFHHRGHAGVHTASAADFASAAYIRGLISLLPPPRSDPLRREPGDTHTGWAGGNRTRNRPLHAELLFHRGSQTGLPRRSGVRDQSQLQPNPRSSVIHPLPRTPAALAA